MVNSQKTLDQNTDSTVSDECVTDTDGQIHKLTQFVAQRLRE